LISTFAECVQNLASLVLQAALCKHWVPGSGNIFHTKVVLYQLTGVYMSFLLYHFHFCHCASQLKSAMCIHIGCVWLAVFIASQVLMSDSMSSLRFSVSVLQRSTQSFALFLMWFPAGYSKILYGW